MPSKQVQNKKKWFSKNKEMIVFDKHETVFVCLEGIKVNKKDNHGSSNVDLRARKCVYSYSLRNIISKGFHTVLFEV